jgi:outer membrane receptor for ferrienterochelin and colicins
MKIHARRLVASTAFTIAASLFAAMPAFAQDHPASEEPEEGEDIVVQATRTGRRVQDEPIRVEVLDREEIEEKILMSPGNIAMLVNETPGVRATAATTSCHAVTSQMFDDALCRVCSSYRVKAWR